MDRNRIFVRADAPNRIGAGDQNLGPWRRRRRQSLQPGGAVQDLRRRNLQDGGARRDQHARSGRLRRCADHQIDQHHHDYSGEAGILASNTNGVTVNAGSSDIIILRGIVIDGAPPGSPGLNGIRFLAGAALHVEKCLIKNFTGANPNGNGILFAPTAASELYVSNTTLINNGNPISGTGASIQIRPTGTGSARIEIDNVRSQNNIRGVFSDSTASTGNIKVSVSSSSIAGNTGLGIGAQTAAAGGVPISIMITGTSVFNNANGVVANGSGATARIGSSMITGSTGTGALILNSGTLLSYKNNQINDNTTDGTSLTQVNLT